MGTATKQQNKVPALRFNGFSEYWDTKSLGSICVKVGSGSTPRGGETVYTNTGILFLRSQNIQDGKLDLNSPTYISNQIHEEMAGSKVEPNDILLNITGGSLGRCCVVPKDFTTGNVSQHVCIIRLDDNNVPDFIRTIIASYNGQKSLLRLQTGSGREGLNFQAVRSFKLAIPTQVEQQKIVDFLGAVDAWIDNLHQQKIALETYKRGMMHKLFTQQVRFKDVNGANFPVWKTVQMNDVGESYSGLVGKSGEDFGQGRPYITYKQIFDNSVIETSKFALVTIAPGERQSQARRGDIFFTVSSETPEEVGYASVLLEDVNPYLNSFSFGFRPKSLAKLLPEYAIYHFRSAPFRRQVVKLAQGSTRYNISKVQFMKLIIELPSFSEQQKIADFLTALDGMIIAKAEEITKAEQWKKGLMQKMFV